MSVGRLPFLATPTRTRFTFAPDNMHMRATEDTPPLHVGTAPAVATWRLDAKTLREARSPLRYPGGKSRAVRTILELIPPDTSTLVSPFIGGGSVELACAALGMKVVASDLFEPLVTFWQQLLADPDAVADEAAKLYPMQHPQFYELQRGFYSLSDPVQCAGTFYALNRASFSGVTLAGGMSPGHPRFTESSIDRLRKFSTSNLTVEHSDFTAAISNAPDDCVMYCDPPYMIESNLYGYRGDMHNGFDHLELARLLTARDNWVLSYNDCAAVRDLYGSYDIREPSWTYGMANDKRSREVLIVNL